MVIGPIRKLTLDNTNDKRDQIKIDCYICVQRLPTPPVQRVVYASQPMYAPMYAPANMTAPVMVMPGTVAAPVYYSYQQQLGKFLKLVYCLVLLHSWLFRQTGITSDYIVAYLDL